MSQAYFDIQIYEDGELKDKTSESMNVSGESTTAVNLLAAAYALNLLSYYPQGEFLYCNLIVPAGVEWYHFAADEPLTDFSGNITIGMWWDAPVAEIIGATVYFDPAGGSVTPTSITEQHEKTGPLDYTVDIDFPVPTKSNWSFDGWYIKELDDTYSAGVHKMGANTSFPEYHAIAQWVKSGTKKVYIYTSSGWQKATAKIYTSSGWKDASPIIY